MARYEAEITIESGHDLKNVNWRNGDLSPYVVAWIDPAAKCSSRLATGGDDDDPIWDEKLVIPLPPGLPLEDATLYLDVVHAGTGEGVKPLVGSARLPLREVLDEVGLGGKLTKKIKLKRPSGRPQGKLLVHVVVREVASRYYDPYGVPPPGTGAGYGYAQAPSGYPYGAPPSGDYGYRAAPAAYGAPPAAYGAPPASYGAAPAAYGAPQAAYGYEQKQHKKGMGMGTGLAVGAAAGLLGGLAIAEGVDYLEDKVEDEVEEEVLADEAADF
ncbi:hypothetical protein Cni_G14141 [Canna indica]|uniref:C2 domain-containing protein n=1 Tax=Canna indica TaxID=4628 RepID=A0AAQ3KBM3_9LILI|nr:hypothetical protein Cni_G14141 [Canna indica]